MGMIINVTHLESEEMEWHTKLEDNNSESDCSITSTPPFKRGDHDQQLTQDAVNLILKESQQFKLTGSPRGPSVTVLADS